MKIVYQTDATGRFLGETLADPSPLERGVYLIPAGCVEVAPPEPLAGHEAVWQGSAWAQVELPTPEAPPPPPPPGPAALNKTQWSFLLDVTGFRDAVDAALAALPKATLQERITWAGMKAVAYDSPEFDQGVTLMLAAQVRAMAIPGLTVPTDAEIIAAWDRAAAFLGAASLGVTP